MKLGYLFTWLVTTATNVTLKLRKGAGLFSHYLQNWNYQRMVSFLIIMLSYSMAVNSKVHPFKKLHDSYWHFNKKYIPWLDFNVFYLSSVHTNMNLHMHFNTPYYFISWLIPYLCCSSITHYRIIMVSTWYSCSLRTKSNPVNVSARLLLLKFYHYIGDKKFIAPHKQITRPFALIDSLTEIILFLLIYKFLLRPG